MEFKSGYRVSMITKSVCSCMLFVSPEERTYVHVKPEVTEPRGDHLGAAIVTVLTLASRRGCYS